MKRFLKLLLPLLAATLPAQTLVVPLGNAKLTTPLNANSQTVNQASVINFGAGNDTTLSRTGPGALTLLGNLTVSGTGTSTVKGTLDLQNPGTTQTVGLTLDHAGAVIGSSIAIRGYPRGQNIKSGTLGSIVFEGASGPTTNLVFNTGVGVTETAQLTLRASGSHQMYGLLTHTGSLLINGTLASGSNLSVVDNGQADIGGGYGLQSATGEKYRFGLRGISTALTNDFIWTYNGGSWSEVFRIGSTGNITAAGSLTARGAGSHIFGSGTRDAVVLESDTAGNGGYVSAKNGAVNDYEPLAIIGETVTLRRRTGVNTSAAGITLDATGNTAVAGNLTAPDLTIGTSGPSVKSSLAARAPTQGLVFQGTALAKGLAKLSTNLGGSEFTFRWKGICPKANDGMAWISDYVAGYSGEFGVICSGTSLWIQLGSDSNRNYLTVPNFTADYAGKVVDLVFVRNASGNPTVYINAVAQSPSFGTTGTAPTWQKSLTSTYAGVGASYDTGGEYEGVLYSELIYNRALSAADVKALTERGMPDAGDYNNASNTVSMITGTDSDFSGAGYWMFAGGASVGSNVLNLPAGGAGYIAKGLVYGKRYRMVYTASVAGIGITDLHMLQYSASSSVGMNSVDFVYAGTNGNIGFNNLGGATGTVDNVTLFPLGLILAPDTTQAGIGNVWNDTSGSNAHIAFSSSGVTWALPSAGTPAGMTIGPGGPSVAGAVATKAPAQRLVFSGSSGASWAGLTPGTGDFAVEIVGWVSDLSDYNIAADTAALPRFQPYIGMNGSINLYYDTTSDVELFPAGTVVANKAFRLYFQRASGVVKASLNGGALTAGVSVATNFSQPISRIGANFNLTKYWRGGLTTYWYNYAKGQSGVTRIAETGAPDTIDFGTTGSVPPSNTNLVGGVFGNYQYDSGTIVTGAATDSFSAVESGGQAAQATTASNSGTFLGRAQAGTKYLVEFSALLNSGAVPTLLLGKANVGPASAQATVVNGANSHILTSTLDFTSDFGANSGNIYFASTGNTNYSISGFKVKRLGLVLAPDIAQAGIGNRWQDASGNNTHISLPAAGVSWAIPSSGLPSDMTFGPNGPNVASSVAARAPLQGLVFSGGQTTGAPVSGVPSFTVGTVAAWLRPDNLTPVNPSSIIGSASQVVDISNTGELRFYSSPSSYNIPGSFTPGENVFVVLVFDGTKISGYKNGLYLGNVAYSGSVSAFTYLGAINGSANPLKGIIYNVLVYNRTLTGAEVKVLAERGAPDANDFNNASNTVAYTSNFAAGEDSWYGQNGTAAGNIDSIGGQNDNLRLTMSGGSTFHQYTRLSVPGYNANKYTGLMVDVYIPSASAAITRIGIANAGVEIAGTTTKDAWTTISADFIPSDIYPRIVVNGGSAVSADGQVVYIRNVRCYAKGLLLAPDIAQAGAGTRWQDTSGNNAHITLPASGVSWAVPSSGYFGLPLTVQHTGSTIATFQRAGFSGGLTVYGDDTGPVIYPTDNTDSLRLNTGGTPRVTITDATTTVSNNLTVSGTGGVTTSTVRSSATHRILYKDASYVYAGDIDNLGIPTMLRAKGTNVASLDTSGISLDAPTAIKGTTTNDNATTGYVGEQQTAQVITGNAVSLTTATSATVVTLSLAAGDWDVQGVLSWKQAAGTTGTYYQCGLSTTAATLGAQGTVHNFGGNMANVTTIDTNHVTPVTRISLASTTTVYLVAKAGFSGSTLAAYGDIRARRVR
jgi:hypothetical protein